MLTRPTKFGPYLLLERVSLGGMAEVFKAVECGVEGFERIVAVKRILPHVAEDEEFITMFKDEARIAVQLQHANIAQIYHLGHEADSFYIALEYVGGRDLRSIFERARKQKQTLPIAEICFIMMQVCEGLDYAHNKKNSRGTPLNIIHRDVSPPNILVSYEGSVKLCDFGVAKAAGRVSQTQAGILKGKFGYMSPEQVRGRSLDRRSDVFAAGVCLWELVTGRRLFHGDTDFSTLEKVRSGTVEPPSTIVPDIPPDLEAVVMHALAAEPDDRISTAMELHDRLRSFMLTQHRDYSRKDLAAWMRKHYADEIEQEKTRDLGRRKDIERFKRGEFPDAHSSSDALRVPPPVPRTASGSVASSNAGVGPVIGGGNQGAAPLGAGLGSGGLGSGSLGTSVNAGLGAPGSGSTTGSVKRPPPKPRGRAKTLLNATEPRPDNTSPGAAAARPANREGMEWDDDELETRLFEDGNSLSMIAQDGGGAGLGASAAGGEEPLARAMRLSQDGQPVDAASASTSRARDRYRNAAASLGSTMSPSASMSRMGELQFQRDDKRKLWMGLGIGGAAIMLLVLVLVMTTGDKEPAPAAVAPTPAAQKAPPVRTGVKAQVLPSDARFTVDGVEYCCGQERIADGIAPGDHRVQVEGGAGFFPQTLSVSVQAGKLTPMEVTLIARRVMVDIRPEPRRAGVFLVQDGQSKRIGRGDTRYEIRRKEGQRYAIKVAAPGFEPQEIPIADSFESTQRFEVTLTPRGRAPRMANPPAGTPATGKDQPTAAATAMLKIGAKLGLPPARVFVDGKEVGKTPINIKVTPGRHRIEWRWSDQRTTKSVTVEGGDTQTVFGSTS